MNNAALYNKTNSLQRKDAFLCLEEYGKNIKWKESGGRVIDVGCGDGSVTAEILRKYVPSNFKIVGSDINEDMVKFAQEHYGRSDIEFTVLNIEEQLPKMLLNSFDHVVSFYALHWVRIHEEAFSNIYDLLSESGSCWLIFLAHMPLNDAWRQLSRMDRWRPWIKDVELYVGSCHDFQEPENVIEKIMKKNGFTNVEVIKKSLVYTYESRAFFKKALTAINPFKIPVEDLDDYIEDTVNEIQRINEANVNNKGLINETFHYTLLIASGSKRCYL